MMNSEEYIVNGRVLSDEDMMQIIEIAKMYPKLDREELIRTMCVNLRWGSIIGGKKEIAFEEFLLELEKKGLIKLPAKKVKKGNWSRKGNKNAFKKKRIIPITCRTEPGEDIYGIVNEFMPVKIELVNDIEKESLWEEYVERYHELKYGSPFGDRLKYFIEIGGEKRQYAGCIMFSASAWSLAARDKWIGWTKQDRVSRLYLIINNTRFLIFPWIKIKNLASWSLAEVSRIIREDWWKKYRYEPVLLETFVDAQKYTGASYKAANWICLGNTKGRGRQDRYNEYLSSPKRIYVYPLVKEFRDYLTGKKEVGGDSK